MAGFFVVVPADRRLFAKVQSLEARGASVEFFRSVASREVVRLKAGEYAHTVLPRETRVFYRLPDDRWQVGRVISSLSERDGLFTYEVKFPNGRLMDISERDLFVRCLDTFADPADILAAGCAETQFFADRRRRALRRLRDLRVAAQGMTGLASAAVEIVPHQVSAARRVLADTTLRYLLADEVGLGKTIEAGAVIRQVLLDDPMRGVAIVAPRSLLGQWRSELQRRFGIEDFPDAVEFLSHEEVATLEVENVPDLLVVDEAHNLIASNEENDTPLAAKRMMDLAKRVPRLLLLSATPALGDEDRLLGLLNLLDPASYPLDDREGFQRKIHERQAIGRLLLPLLPGRPALVLRQQAQQALSMFPRDPIVQGEAKCILAEGVDRQSLDNATESLRDHIIRSYRLHNRLIRTRRSDVDTWFRSRGPDGNQLNHVRFEFSEEMQPGGLAAILEAWRLDARDAPDVLRPTAIERWLKLFEAAWRGQHTLITAVREMKPLFNGEDQHLDALRAWGQREGAEAFQHAAIERVLHDWKHTTKQALFRTDQPPPKIVCFVSDPEEGRRILDYLRRKLGRFNVASVLEGSSTEAAADTVQRFKDDLQAWVLLCDTSGEEGLNLQFVHTILHVDLPFAAARLEQRIGRLDRFGRRLPTITHRVLFPDDDEDSPWRAWFDLLANGFHIFNRSISDVQFRLDAVSTRLAEAFFLNGTISLQTASSEIEAELADERQKLDEQSALDHLARISDSADSLVQGIEDAEEDEAAIASDLSPWIGQVLQLVQVPPHDAADTIRYFWGPETLLPKFPWREALEPGLDRPSTWRRQRAQSTGPVPTLLRPGSPLINALERVARWDDRGIAFATWRVEPGWPEMWRGFRLIWIVEPALKGTGPVWVDDVANELSRRAAAILPVTTYEQFVDETGAIVTDPALLDIIRRDYVEGRRKDGRCDVNLGSRPEALAQAIDPAFLRKLIGDVRRSCEDALRIDPEFVVRRAEAIRLHERESFRARRSLEQRNRLHRAERGHDMPEYLEEVAALELLGNAVREPSVRLDEIGYLVISGAAPFARAPQ